MKTRRFTIKTDHYFYEKILDEKISKIAQKNPVVITQVLTDKLRKAIFLEGKSENRDYSKDDISYVWRPAIEEHPNNWGLPDVKSLLVSSLRDTLEIAGEKDIELLKKALAIIKKENYSIFKRLELFVYKNYFKEFMPEIEKIILDYFGRGEYLHEYYLLLKSSFPHISSELKTKLLELIDKGPNKEKFHGTSEEFEMYKKRWRVDKLEPIISYLPEKKEEYDKLLKEVGQSELSSFVVTHSAFQEVKQPTELTDEMTVDEVISYVNKYQVSKEIFPEEDGSARKFKELVLEKPQEFSSKSMNLQPIHPIFYSRFFGGLTDAIKGKKTIDWDSVLQLSEKIINKIDDEIYQSMKKSILSYMAGLLDVGLLHDDNSIKFSNKEQVWKVLENIINHSKGDDGWSKNYPEGNTDSMMISINSATGRAMHALMQYTVWCYYGFKNEGKILEELVPEAKKLLETSLDPNVDNSISTHAVFGFHLHNLFALDKKWTKANIYKIFPGGDNSLLGDAAWESYLFQKLYRNIFVELKEEYEKRIIALKTLKPRKIAIRDPWTRMAKHIGQCYLSNIKNADYLFELFLKNAPENLLKVCIEDIGRILEYHKKEQTQLPIDLKGLWSRPEIMSRPESGWFFVNSPLEKEWNIKKLSECLDATSGKISPIHQIPKELLEYSKEFPFETMVCVEKIVNANLKGWELYHMKDELKEILKNIKSSSNEEAIKKMNIVLDILGKSGFEEFRELS